MQKECQKTSRQCNFKCTGSHLIYTIQTYKILQSKIRCTYIIIPFNLPIQILCNYLGHYSITPGRRVLFENSMATVFYAQDYHSKAA